MKTAPDQRSSPLLPHVRLYSSLRAAHLERAHELQPASILYRVKRYDYDERLAAGLDLRPAGALAGALLIARSKVTTLEINEPLMLPSLAASALAVMALRFNQFRGQPRASVVTYAIGNADPFAPVAASTWRTRVRRRVERMLARRVWLRVDRAAFGTSAAQETYETVLGTVSLRSSSLVFPALPAAREGVHDYDRVTGRVVFLGAFTDRKGIRVVLDAWPIVRRARPFASLLVMGKGRLQPEVLTTAAIQPGIEVEVDPGRDRIHSRLDESQILVLPSQPSPTWREQVGLPIVEGLSHGLSIVTTEQTGLAEWLAANGHYVVRDPRSATEVAEAIIQAIDSQRSPLSVVESLPRNDGRLTADEWLFSTNPTISDLARVYTS